MSGIVCAIRGGPASRPTINRAVSLAKETGLPLYFLFVVNLDFLSHTASSRVLAVSDEMREMGEFIILAAQEKAAAQGIIALGKVLQGNVWEEISQFCREQGADYLVLGRPLAQESRSVSNSRHIQGFGQQIEDETPTQVIIASGEPE